MFDEASKYTFVLKDIQSIMLLNLIERYVNGAELQITRIDRTRTLIKNSLSPYEAFERTRTETHHRRQRILFHDAHFYFIYISKVGKGFKRFCDRLESARLYKLCAKLEKEFSREIRNDLEHIDERAVGARIPSDLNRRLV